MNRPFKRRSLILGSLAAIGFARANSKQVWRIALVTSSPGAHILDIIRTSLRSAGYEQDKDFVIDFREASGHFGVLPALVDELIALKPDLIIAEATPAIAAVQKATTTIPVIMAPATDPIGSGFVKSFTHPGGNITGVANMFGDSTTKILDIIKLTFPNANKIGVLTSNNPTHPPLLELAVRAAKTMGISASGFVAKNPEDLGNAFAEMKAANCEAVYVLADPPRPALPAIALKARLPTIFQVSSYVTLYDGLMSYGPNIRSFYTMAADYAVRIMKGADPKDLPVEQPTTFDFTINLRTAQAFGIAIPEKVLLMADQIIE
jgi:putative ABC transport system substrate-binding protein